MGEKRGRIAFFSTFRPPIPLDIYACPIPPSSKQDEIPLTDALSYNYNARSIPSQALKTILKRPRLASIATAADVDSGRVSGLIFVSERTNNLETLHIGLRITDGNTSKFKVFSFAEIYDTFKGVRMEDSGCIAGNYLVYVSTMQPNPERRQPWTVVYKTNLKTGTTERLTPNEQADLSPSVSPDGKKIAMASFQRRSGWHGEIEDLKTDIFVMNVDPPFNRKFTIENGGWPTWGSNDILFFHRKVDNKYWGVFRADIRLPRLSNVLGCVSPAGVDAMTPSAIDADRVVLATVRQKSNIDDVRLPTQYRHIEIFDTTTTRCQVESIQITQRTRPKGDHFNPFVFADKSGKKFVGYHRCKSDLLKAEQTVEHQFDKLHSPDSDVGVFRVSGVFPTFSKDGSKLAYVDNEFKSIWVADKNGLRVVYETRGPDNVFAPVWNPNSLKDELYVCMGKSFHPDSKVEICAIPNASAGNQHRKLLTKDYNDAFPSPSPDGTKLVFRSTRAGKVENNNMMMIYKNLYIMEDVELGEYGGSKITRLTEGRWIDTHCQWSPQGDWIVFSSTRDKPKTAPKTDNGLDSGYFAIYLVKASDPSVVVRVLTSSGHVNHPMFSPDGNSIVVTADLAGVSCDPISLPVIIQHSVRPYGDIFVVDIDAKNIRKNKDVKKFKRITHSRYENATASWTEYSTQDPKAKWILHLNKPYAPACPYAYRDGGETWHMTGHLCIKTTCC